MRDLEAIEKHLMALGIDPQDLQRRLFGVRAPVGRPQGDNAALPRRADSFPVPTQGPKRGFLPEDQMRGWTGWDEIPWGQGPDIWGRGREDDEDGNDIRRRAGGQRRAVPALGLPQGGQERPMDEGGGFGSPAWHATTGISMPSGITPDETRRRLSGAGVTPLPLPQSRGADLTPATSNAVARPGNALGSNT